jgi:hypothetical protein
MVMAYSGRDAKVFTTAPLSVRAEAGTRLHVDLGVAHHLGDVFRRTAL